MKISQIIDKINEKHLFVPAFQREYVWKKPDAKNLVSSLINDYPTGTMLTWETTNPPELKGEHPSPFPEEIITLPILQTSKEFELVLDPFMGSGTTGRVCDKLRRSFVGYDLKEYLLISSNKTQQHDFRYLQNYMIRSSVQP